MPIAVACPSCGHSKLVPDEFAGRRAKCPKCGTAFVVPSGSSEAESGDAEPLAAPVKWPKRPVGRFKSKPALRPQSSEDGFEHSRNPPRMDGGRHRIGLWIALGASAFTLVLTIVGATLWATGFFVRPSVSTIGQQDSANNSFSRTAQQDDPNHNLPEPPLRLGINEVRAGDVNDDLELAKEKFDAKFKGRVLEIYGVVHGIERHKGGLASVNITIPWAMGSSGLTFTVAEAEKLDWGNPVLVRCLCQGFKTRLDYEPGSGAAPFIAASPQLVLIPEGQAGHPKAYAALVKLENLTGKNSPVRISESIDKELLTVRVRPLDSYYRGGPGSPIDWSIPPIDKWPAALYAFRFGNDPLGRIVLIDDISGNRIGEFSLKEGLVLADRTR
jgi:hypothetical protein